MRRCGTARRPSLSTAASMACSTSRCALLRQGRASAGRRMRGGTPSLPVCMLWPSLCPHARRPPTRALIPGFPAGEARPARQPSGQRDPGLPGRPGGRGGCLGGLAAWRVAGADGLRGWKDVDASRQRTRRLADRQCIEQALGHAHAFSGDHATLTCLMIPPPRPPPPGTARPLDRPPAAGCHGRRAGGAGCHRG